MDKYDRLAAATQVASEANARLKVQYDQAFAEWEAKKSGGLGRPRSKDMPLWPEVQAAGEALLKLVMADFRGEVTEEDRVTIKSLFNDREKMDALNASGFRLTDAESVRNSGLSDSVVGVMTAKWMLSVERLPLDTTQIKAFEEFADHFKSIIIP